MYIYDNDNNLLAIVIKNGTSTKDKDFHTDHSSELQIASFNLKKDELIILNKIDLLDEIEVNEKVKNFKKKTKKNSLPIF